MPLQPKQSADDGLRRARAIVGHAKTKGLPKGVSEDLLRMALVMAVGALDTYMHVAILRNVSDKRADLPKALRRLEIRFEDFCVLAEDALDAQREERKVRPWVQVKNALHRYLLRKTFQSFEEIGNAMSMAGTKKGWEKVSNSLGDSAGDIEEWLNYYVHRRNQIVHESDLQRSSRPRQVKHNSINASDVEEALDWFEDLVDAIDKVVMS